MTDKTNIHRTMIMVAPNGARLQKSDHPKIPLSPEELAIEALACAKAGASAIHLHVRNEEGGHVLDVGLYRQAIDAVRKAVGEQINIQITTEAVGIYTAKQQIACVRGVVPDAISVALKEIISDIESEPAARAFFLWMQENKVSPQFILYDAQEVDRFFELQAKGVIPFKAPFLLFVLGRYTKDQQSQPSDLDPFIEALGQHNTAKIPWACCAFGRREAACAAYASKCGGHVRVGFENNLFLPSGTVAKGNAELVAATVDLVSEHSLIMSAAQARVLLSSCLR